MTLKDVEVDWSDNSELLKGNLSFDNVNAEGNRNTSWETSVSHSKNDQGVTNTFMSTAFNFSTRPSHQRCMVLFWELDIQTLQ